MLLKEEEEDSDGKETFLGKGQFREMMERRTKVKDMRRTIFGVLWVVWFLGK